MSYMLTSIRCLLYNITMSAAKTSKKSAKGPSQEKIIADFNQLRQENRNLMAKVSELEGDVNEHRLVIETLKDVDGDRKCCRLVGGILVERTVKDVLPALEHNKEQIEKLVETLGAQIQAKSAELAEYREKYNIKVKGEQPPATSEEEKSGGSSQGVLVAKDSK